MSRNGCQRKPPRGPMERASAAAGPTRRGSIHSAARVKQITAAAAGPWMPSRGAPSQPRVKAPVSGICSALRRHQRIARRLHVAGAAQHGGQRVGDPVREAAEEQHVGEGDRALERAAAAAQQAVDRAAETGEDGREQQRHAERDGKTVRRGRFRSRAIVRAQGARHRGGDAAAHRAGRHLAERHLRREDERQGGEVDDAELSHEEGVGDADQALHRHVQHVGGREREDGGNDRAAQHHLPAFGGCHAGVSITRPREPARAYLMRG